MVQTRVSEPKRSNTNYQKIVLVSMLKRFAFHINKNHSRAAAAQGCVVISADFDNTDGTPFSLTCCDMRPLRCLTRAIVNVEGSLQISNR